MMRYRLGVVASAALMAALTSCAAAAQHQSRAGEPAGFARIDGSRAINIINFAQLRGESTAVVMASAQTARAETVTSGPLAGYAITRTPATVDKVLWGTSPSNLVVSQLGADASTIVTSKYLLAGSQYVLFLRPNDLDPQLGYFAVTEGVAYVKNGAEFDRVLDAPSALPVTLSADTAAQQVTQ